MDLVESEDEALDCGTWILNFLHYFVPDPLGFGNGRVDPERFTGRDSIMGKKALVVGVAWYLPRARIERRWRAALDLYAEQEQAKETYPWRNSRH
jgi:hypothetical protein